MITLAKHHTGTLYNYIGQKSGLENLDLRYIHTKREVFKRPPPKCTCTDQPTPIAWECTQKKSKMGKHRSLDGISTGPREMLIAEVLHINIHECNEATVVLQ